ncbi:MAG: hypothetical protein LBW85_10420 [Deltaproteobacteria bacterium]|jgi:hypothetical protein|nr:hypothetical protein [Deltaproteobacteria bacterium]
MKSPVSAVPALLAALALAVVSALSAPLLEAQTLTEVLTGQPALTEAEIPAALELLKAGQSQDSANQAMSTVIEQHGITQERAMYLVTKLLTFLDLSVQPNVSPGEVAARFGSPLALPTPEEVETLKPHAREIFAAMDIPVPEQ